MTRLKPLIVSEYISPEKALKELEGYSPKPNDKPNKKPADKPETSNNKIIHPANINLDSYVQIPNTKIIIAREETHRSKDWKETHFALSEEGLFMPPPRLFMPHFMNVIEASKGKAELLDGNGNPLSKVDAEDLDKYLTSNQRNGCWTHLDAMFVQDHDSDLFLETNHRVVNGKLIAGKREKLEDCLMEDAFAKLEFNSQGLATKKSRRQAYNQGKNIYFLYPRKDDTVAGFGSGSGRVGLSCYRNHQYSCAGLGVFACAEGTQYRSRKLFNFRRKSSWKL